MDSYLQKKREGRFKRALRIRKQVKGDKGKPRLCVFRSNKHLSAQIIDDKSGKTLCSVSTLSNEFKTTEFKQKSKSSADALGKSLAEKAKKAGVGKVVFDRGPYKYHGVVASLAEAVRTAGIEF